MQNPFSTTFNRIPENTYIKTNEINDILDNFSYEDPTESVYKITGVRGSGKTVILSKIQKEMSADEYKKSGWLVYGLNPSRDMLQQLAALLSKEPFLKSRANDSAISISANVLGYGGGISISPKEKNNIFDIGAELEVLLQKTSAKKKKVLICVDEVSKNQNMIEFALEFGKWLIEGLPVFFICTGLYENVAELGNVKNLTFFRRGKPIDTKPLNNTAMTEIYKTRLKISTEAARGLAEITKGYAYAFQLLGSLYFDHQKDLSQDEIVGMLKSQLFAYSYEKIWEELSENDKMLVRLLTEKEEYKRSEILLLMGDKAGAYSVYRDRLLKRGIIKAKQGYIGINPPYFAEYVKEYGIE